MDNNSKRDYYEILGVNKGAADDELKKAYRQVAKKYHPDVNPGDKEAESKFKEANEAYEVLSNSEKRQKYDAYGHAGVDPNFGAGGGGFGGGFDFGDIGDIFGSFFGGGFGGGAVRNGPQRGSNVEASITLTFDEAVFGCTKEISYSKIDNCSECSGTGAKRGTNPESCPTCRGAGQVRSTQRTILGNVSTTRPCDTCRGTGTIIKNPCTSCSGQGQKRATTTRKVNIPAGIDNGQTLRVQQDGNAGKKGGPSGDLLVNIKVKPHKLFDRRGFDIYCEVPITFSQAALGASIEVPTIDGKIKYDIPEGTQGGTVIRLKNKGVQLLNGKGRGDEHITVVVDVPTKLNEKQKEALKTFSELTGTENHSKQKGFFEKLKDIFN